MIELFSIEFMAAIPGASSVNQLIHDAEASESPVVFYNRKIIKRGLSS